MSSSLSFLSLKRGEGSKSLRINMLNVPKEVHTGVSSLIELLLPLEKGDHVSLFLF